MKHFEVRITEEERRKCKKVTEAFEEYFDEMEDTVVVDAGKFGYLWLRWFNNGEFDGQDFFSQSEDLFEALWEAWKEHHLLTPVLGTPMAELEYDELYARLTLEQKNGFELKKAYFRKRAFN